MAPKGKKKAAAIDTKALNNFSRLLLAFGSGNGGLGGGSGGSGGKGGDGGQNPDGRSGKRKRDPVWGDWFCKNCSVKDPTFFVFKKNDNCPKCDGHKGDHFKGWALKKDAASSNASSGNQKSQPSSSDSDLVEENKKLKEELKSVREAAGAKGVEMPKPVVPDGPPPERLR